MTSLMLMGVLLLRVVLCRADLLELCGVMYPLFSVHSVLEKI